MKGILHPAAWLAWLAGMLAYSDWLARVLRELRAQLWVLLKDILHYAAWLACLAGRLACRD